MAKHSVAEQRSLMVASSSTSADPDRWGLVEKLLTYRDWLPEMHPAVNLLKLLVDNEAAVEQGDGAWVGHETVACMAPDETTLLGLPRACPYALRFKSSGAASIPSSLCIQPGSRRMAPKPLA